MSQPAWDDDWIDGCLERGEVFVTGVANRLAYQNCRWCAHYEHGFKCKDCPCESSYTSRDDSWRPQPDTRQAALRQFAHTYGLDGYTARAVCVPSSIVGAVRRTRLRNLLGEGSR